MFCPFAWLIYIFSPCLISSIESNPEEKQMTWCQNSCNFCPKGTHGIWKGNCRSWELFRLVTGNSSGLEWSWKIPNGRCFMLPQLTLQDKTDAPATWEIETIFIDGSIASPSLYTLFNVCYNDLHLPHPLIFLPFEDLNDVKLLN